MLHKERSLTHIRWLVHERTVCVHVLPPDPVLVHLKACVQSGACYHNQHACSCTVHWINSLLKRSLEIQFSCQSLRLHSVLYGPSQSSVSSTPSACLSHQSALIALLQMIPRIWLERLQGHITLIIVSTPNVRWTCSAVEISPRGNEKKAELSLTK